jgi:hypothetical protein
MKVKLKFDPQSIKAFLLENVEKIVAGIVVLATLLIMYGAWKGAARFTQTPENLKAEAEKGKQQIDQTSPDTEIFEMVDYPRLALQGRQKIVPKLYAQANAWDPPWHKRKGVRGEPPLYAPTRLRAIADRGAFRMMVAAQPAPVGVAPPGPVPGPPPGPGPIPVARQEVQKGQQWVVVTGLVPAKKEEAAYEEAFKSTVGYDPVADSPKYLGYRVQRVEVSGPAEAANPPWGDPDKVKEFISRQEEQEAIGNWPANGRNAEVAPAEYIDERLAFPLGPLVGRSWEDDSVVYPGEVPLKRDEAAITGQAPAEATPEAKAPAGTERNPFGPFDETPGPAAPGGAKPPPAAEKAPPKDKPKLLRFFDFYAESGKRYVYRVRLALKNPNQDKNPASLTNPELASKLWIETKWSEPSPMVFVPREAGGFLSAVKSPARPGAEPTGQIVLTKWEQRDGREGWAERSGVVRGQVLNYADMSLSDPRPSPVAGQPAPATAAASRPFTANVYTEATAVDFRGGQRPGRKATTGEMLMLDAEGNLVVRNEADDKPLIDRYRPSSGPPAAPAVGAAAAPPKGGLDMLAR